MKLLIILLSSVVSAWPLLLGVSVLAGIGYIVWRESSSWDLDPDDPRELRKDPPGWDLYPDDNPRETS